MENKTYISDELLATYLDGNTNEAETLEVLNAIKDDPSLKEVLDIALDLEEEESATYNVLPMMKLAAESGNNICSVLCEAYVLRKRHIPYEEESLLELAKRNGWLRAEGTPLHAIGQLLVRNGLMITHKYGASVNDICDSLAEDNDVIVVVDSDKLCPERDDIADEPNHAMVAISVGASTKTITLYDPMKDDNLIVSITQFVNAWKESNSYMVRILQSIDDYTPQPITLDEIKLTDELLELREAIAENAHDVWANARMKEGWTYGHERNDVLKKHPDLIPYSALPDSEKEYDRIMAFDTIRLVEKLGFKIVKK